MDAEIISGIVELIVKLGSAIKSQITYLCCPNSYVQRLVDEVKKLEIERQMVQQRVDVAVRNLESIRPNVQDWLTRVDDWLDTSHEIINKARCRHNSSIKRFFFKWLPMIHYLQSMEAQKAIDTSIQLQISHKFDKVSNPLNPVDLPPLPLSTSYDLLDSRALLEKQVMKAFEDDSIYLVGLCGMGGIGKTTMANKMIAWAQKSKIFGVAIFVVVSQKLNIIEVQQQIAERLGLELKEHSLRIRVEKIHQRLKEEKSFLIVFDGVWEKFKLEDIGIPSKCTTKRRKLILTSQNKDALLKVTNDHYKIFTLDILQDEEAWKLFREKAGDSIEGHGLEKIAKQLAKKCKGLPLALAVFGSALRDKNISIWEDALDQLLRSHIPSHILGVHDELYVPLKWSYEQLQGEQVKRIFLFCCLFPTYVEIPTKYFVRFGWALNFFNDIETMKKARDRVSSLIHSLKCQFLLTQASRFRPFFGTGEYVRVHDIIREMGFSIAHEDGHVFMVSEGNLLRKSSYDNISHSFIRLDGKLDLPETLNCPRLEFLHMNLSSKFESEIPEEFFSSMEGLKVLVVCSFRRKKLPSSISKLINLQVIQVEGFSLGTMESIFRNMVHLEVINLSYSSLDVLPREIGQLKSLRVLDLRRSEIISIESGVISELDKLEELLMHQCKLQNKEKEAETMVLEEIASLSNLVNLQVGIWNQNVLSLNKPFQPELNRFVFLVQYDGALVDNQLFDKWALYNKIAFFNCKEAVPISPLILSIIRNVESLWMSGDGCTLILDDLYNTKFEKLKNLHLTSFQDREYLVQPIAASQSPRVLENRSVLFLELESLSLERCQNLKEISPEQPCIGSFGSLKKLDLNDMKVMKHAIPVSKFHICSRLEVLEINACPSMENIFMEEGREDHVTKVDTNKIEFLSLRDVLLKKLHQMDVFGKDIEEIKFPALKRLEIKDLPKMITFASTPNYNSNDYRFLFNIKIICPNLKRLILERISSCGIFNSNITEGCFDQLEYLTIRFCDNLKNVMAHSLSKNLKNLKLLCISYAKELEEVIMPNNNEKGEEVGHENNTKEILFPQLQRLLLTNLPKMHTFFHVSTHIELPSSLEVTIENCPLLNTFSLGSVYCPNIKVSETRDPTLINKIFQISTSAGPKDIRGD